MKLSVIIPCKNEEGNVAILYKNISEILDKLKYELIFIDDGSSDGTLEELKKIYIQDVKHIKVISFSRNFQKENAILAGLEYASGELTCIIGGNLKQNPKYILEMYNFLEENNHYDSVAMVAENNNDSKFLKFLKDKFYSSISRHSGLDIRNNIADYRMFRNNVKEAVTSIKEKNRFSKGIFAWVGFNTKYINYKMNKNIKSSYNSKGLLTYAVNGYCGYSYKLLNLSVKLGVTSLLVALIYFIVLLIQIIGFNLKLKATYVLIILMLLLFGIQFILIGIVGKYLALVSDEAKNRPNYIIKEKIGFGNETIL